MEVETSPSSSVTVSVTTNTPSAFGMIDGVSEVAFVSCNGAGAVQRTVSVSPFGSNVPVPSSIAFGARLRWTNMVSPASAYGATFTTLIVTTSVVSTPNTSVTTRRKTYEPSAVISACALSLLLLTISTSAGPLSSNHSILSVSFG